MGDGKKLILYILICKLTSQVITVDYTGSLVTMEGAFLIIVGVMAIMTVEITVTKRDVVCDVK